MIRTMVSVVVVLLAALLVFAATKPDIFRLQRATSIKVPVLTLLVLPVLYELFERGRR